jgi:hypothetical protein
MKWRILVVSFVFIVSLWNIPLGPVGADLPPDDYNLTKYDPKEDVMRLRTGGTCLFAEKAHVEVTKITSTYIGSVIADQIELTMIVEGAIQNNENYTYFFAVYADISEYIFVYSNGIVIGFELGSDALLSGVSSSGDGTNELIIAFNVDSIGPPSVSYDFNAGAVYNNGDYERYFDFAPDKLLLITEPSEGSTVNGLIDVIGVIRESIETRPSGNVRIRIDGGSWEYVPSTNPWSYPLDTTLLSEGEHTIYVEVEGESLENAKDEISITVDQNIGSYESFDQKPEMNVGDWYTYESIGNTNMGGLSLEMRYEAEVRVETFETIFEGGIEYEAYGINTYTENEQDFGYITWQYEIDRTSWRENENFGVVKERTITTSQVTFRSETTTDLTTIYSPPLDNHNNFLVTKGFDNRWIFHTRGDSVSNTTTPELTKDNPGFSENLEVTGECLYYKASHVVFNHTFEDIYLIKTYLENPGIFTVEYYSPEMGVPVQVDIYDPNRNLITSVGLRIWEKVPYSIEIAKVTFNPDEPVVDIETEIIIVIRNTGSESASDIKVTVMDGETEVAQKTIPSIPSNDNEDIIVDWTPLSEGNHNITVIASYGDIILDEESYEVFVKPSDNGDVGDGDKDEDDLPDSWEEEHFGNLSEDGEGDFDGDGLSNNDEYNNNTNPKDEDTDGDGMPDSWEIENGLNATLNDSGLDADEDGHTNLEEYLNETDPQDENDPPDVTDKGEESPSFEYWWMLLLLILIAIIIVIVLLGRKGKKTQEIPPPTSEEQDQSQEPITDEELRSPPPPNQTYN